MPQVHGAWPMRRREEGRLLRGLPRNGLSMGLDVHRTGENWPNGLDEASVSGTRESMKGKKRKSKSGYNERHAESGLTTSLPDIETFPNQYKGYDITIEIP